MLTDKKEDVAKQLSEVADKIKDIANDIANDHYDPRKWDEVSTQFAPLFVCLKTFPQEFMKGYIETYKDIKNPSALNAQTSNYRRH